MSERSFEVRHGSTMATDEAVAAEELRVQLAQPGPFTTLFFCSPSYDLPRLASELRRAFPGALFGCTSAGQIGRAGFQRGGITAVSLGHAELRITPWTIRPLSLVAAQAADIGRAIHASRKDVPAALGAFGLLLVDGLSLAEERVASSLHHALRGIPLVGGSAGDDLAFASTHVFADGSFTSDTALLLLFETTLPFRIIKFQHFKSTGRLLVVTGADPERRIVTEINGKPAAEEYARLVNRSVAELDAEVFAQHPVMLHIEGEYYVRSIYKMTPEGHLIFFCAIEEGLVLHLGRGVDVLQTIEASLGEGAKPPDLVIGCDCILRRIELEQRSLDGAVGDALARHGVFGFSTYGEQYNGIHVNQTFTGVSLGG